MARCIRTTHNMSLKTASESPGYVLGSIMLLVRLSDVQMRVYFGILDNPTELQFFGTFFTDRFVKEEFTWYVASSPFGVASYCYLGIHPIIRLARCIQWDSDIEKGMNDQPDNTDKMQLFRIAKCVSITPNTEVWVSVTTSRTELIFLTLHANEMHDQMVLPAPGIVNAQTHKPVLIHADNFCEN